VPTTEDLTTVGSSVVVTEDITIGLKMNVPQQPPWDFTVVRGRDREITFCPTNPWLRCVPLMEKAGAFTLILLYFTAVFFFMVTMDILSIYYYTIDKKRKNHLFP
jgi:hypothetical protein